MKRGRVFIGCSGWSYKDWRGRFYPTGLPAARWFEYYAENFRTVELNNTFYRVPPAGTWEKWRERAPRGFVYAVKANRFLTHRKKLEDPEPALSEFHERCRLLGRHLGPVLYQLPPSLRRDMGRLQRFLALLPKGQAHVFEFRDASWYEDATFALLEEWGASFCVHDMRGAAVPRRATGSVAYVRFHGTGPRYAGSYPEAALRCWADWLREQAAAGRSCFAYFNNDVEAQSVTDARRLMRLLDE